MRGNRKLARRILCRVPASTNRSHQRVLITIFIRRARAGITRRCLELGLHMNIVQIPGASSVFRIAPALTSGEEELSLGLEILDRAIGEAVG